MSDAPKEDGILHEDPYSRVEYRRMIAWPARIQRESGFLLRVLGSGPSRSVLDLGCGTGEHSRYLVDQGFEVLGVDRSETMISKASDTELPSGLCFLQADIATIGEAIEGEYGGAICLGNTLPHIRQIAHLEEFLRGLRRRLLPGAPFLLQILNYGRVVAQGERHLPLNFRPDESGELIFLRLMEVQEDGSVLFFPSTLKFRPDADPPLELLRSKRVELQGWRAGQLTELLAAAGFCELELFGDIEGGPFIEDESRDLIVVAR